MKSGYFDKKIQKNIAANANQQSNMLSYSQRTLNTLYFSSLFYFSLPIFDRFRSFLCKNRSRFLITDRVFGI